MCDDINECDIGYSSFSTFLETRDFDLWFRYAATHFQILYSDIKTAIRVYTITALGSGLGEQLIHQ